MTVFSPTSGFPVSKLTFVEAAVSLDQSELRLIAGENPVDNLVAVEEYERRMAVLVYEIETLKAAKLSQKLTAAVDQGQASPGVGKRRASKKVAVQEPLAAVQKLTAAVVELPSPVVMKAAVQEPSPAAFGAGKRASKKTTVEEPPLAVVQKLIAATVQDTPPAVVQKLTAAAVEEPLPAAFEEPPLAPVRSRRPPKKD